VIAPHSSALNGMGTGFRSKQQGTQAETHASDKTWWWKQYTSIDSTTSLRAPKMMKLNK
jgi:hypothetical protein